MCPQAEPGKARDAPT